MIILTLTSNNISDWTFSSQSSCNSEKPRLPLPYLLGGAFLNSGHKLCSLDVSNNPNVPENSQFTRVYRANQFELALDSVDVSLLWGNQGLQALLLRLFKRRLRTRIVLISYTYGYSCFNLKQILRGIIFSLLAKNADVLLFMTAEQARLARRSSSPSTKVVKFLCGIDTSFYRSSISLTDVPSNHRTSISLLLTEPYVIMHGDELRLNSHALRFVKQSGIRLVRVSQYPSKSNINKLKQSIYLEGLQDRLWLFESVSYRFLLFLLRNACAYAGFVDSSWQPAGWTASCEALASGLPIFTYDGLVPRELCYIMPSREVILSFPMREPQALFDSIANYSSRPDNFFSKNYIANLAKDYLDLSQAGEALVDNLKSIL